MIRIEPISANAVKVFVPEKLQADDFHEIEPRIDALIAQSGQIRLLIDARHFHGWEDIAAFECHAGFVKDHHRKVQRIAVIVGRDWQSWLIAFVRLFVHPEARAFDSKDEDEARRWLLA